MKKQLIALVNFFMLLLLVTVLFAGTSIASGIKVVPSTPWAVPGGDFSFDIVAEGIPVDGLGGVQFRLNVNSAGAKVTGISELSLAGASDVSIASPLLISPSTSSRSGIGEFFWNSRGPNNILIMDNEQITGGTGLYTFAHTNGSTPPTGNGTVARFVVRIGSGVTAERIDINLSEVMLLDGGPVYPLEYNIGASVPLKCMTTVPSLLGLSLVQAQSALAVANLLPGTIHEVNNANGSLPLNVVLEQSSPAQANIICQTPVNLAVNTPPAEITQASAVDKPHDQTGAVLLTWVPSTSGDVAGYRIYKGTTFIRDINNPLASGAELGGLPNAVATQLKITAYDTFGNESQGTTISATPLDDVPPTVVVATPSTGTFTKVRQVTVSGTVSEPVSSVTVRGIPATVAGQSWSVECPIYEGPNILPVQAVDLSGNTGMSSITVTLDTSLPALSVSTLAGGSYTNNNVLNITGTVADTVSGIKELTVNNEIVPVNIDGSFSRALVLNSGPNTITVIVTDLAGNQTSDTRTITLDQSIPQLAITAPADNAKTGAALITVTGSVDETSTVTIKLGTNVQTAVMNGTNFTADLLLVSGYNTIEITATDLAGNSNNQKRTVVYDDQKPTLAVTEPPQDIQTKQGSLTIRGTASDPLTAVSVAIVMDDQSYTPPLINGVFEQTVNFTAQKSYSIVVTATNEVGTTTTVQRNVIFDITPPALAVNPVTTPTNQASQILSGTMEAGIIVNVSSDTATIGNVSYPTATTWSVPVSGFISEINDIVISVADIAGNITTAATRIIYDITPPTGSVLINNGAATTNSTQVQLTLSAVDAGGVSLMQFSNDGNNWSDPETYNSSKAWNLPAGFGLKQVFARYRDNAGNWSVTPVSAIIAFDDIPPLVYASPAAGVYKTAQSVKLTANEVATIYYTVDGSEPALTSSVYGTPLTITASTTVKCLAVDSAGNAGRQTFSYVIDNIPPQLSVSMLSDGAYTNNETLNIAGSITDNTGVQMATINGATVPINADGSFSYALLMKAGANLITTIATDLAGNQTIDLRTINLDLTAPSMVVNVPADNSKTGAQIIDVTGVVDENAVVQVKVKDVVQYATMNGTNFSTTVMLSSGLNTIEITATDLAGNTGTLKRTVLYDDGKPSLSITDPVQDIRTNHGSITIRGTVIDTLTAVNVKISVNGEIFSPPVINGLFEQVITFTEEKTYAVIVTATNEVGTSVSAQRNIIYDITPPSLSIAPVSTPTNQNSQIVSGAMDYGAIVTVSCATATVSQVVYLTTTSWQVNVSGLKEGENVIIATAVDQTGNVSTASAKIVLYTIPPDISINANPNLLWPLNHGMIHVKLSGEIVSHGSEIQSVAISVADEYGIYNYSNLKFGDIVLLEAWRNGNDLDGRVYTVTVIVTDTAGNKTTRTTSVIVPHDMRK